MTKPEPPRETTDSRILKLEQALRQVNHLQHSLAIEQDGSGNMRIEYWTRKMEEVIVEALAPAPTPEPRPATLCPHGTTNRATCRDCGSEW